MSNRFPEVSMSHLRLLLALPVLACASAQPASEQPAPAQPAPASSTPPAATQVTRIFAGDFNPDLAHFEMVSGPDAGSVSYFRAPRDQVWPILPQTFQAVGLNGQVLNAATYEYGQPERTARMRLGDSPLSRYFDCGARSGIPNADNFTVTYTITSQLHPGTEGRTQLRTRITASARSTGTGDLRVRCASTGAMERRIHDFVARRLPAGG